MKRAVICIAFLIFSAGFNSSLFCGNKFADVANSYESLYSEIRLTGVIDYTAFAQAMFGYERIDNRKKDILVVIDFSKPSTEKRMYVIDVKDKKLLYHTHVAHGRNSGENYATMFSNTPESYQSSLGFFITENTYTGRNGYSLILDGLEKGINDKAKERAIVIHGADYCDPAIIKKAGRLGRSFGCPALPRDHSDQIIDTIKEGAVIYIYADNTEYVSKTTML